MEETVTIAMTVGAYKTRLLFDKIKGGGQAQPPGETKTEVETDDSVGKT